MDRVHVPADTQMDKGITEAKNCATIIARSFVSVLN